MASETSNKPESMPQEPPSHEDAACSGSSNNSLLTFLPAREMHFVPSWSGREKHQAQVKVGMGMGIQLQ